MFLNEEELKKLNLKSIGKNVLISDKASIYGAERISIGNNVRIDDFCILSGNIKIGDNVHISAFCALYGGSEENSGIILKNNSGCSTRTTIYSVTDDFKNAPKIGVMEKEEERILIIGKVIIEEFAQVGASCCIFPNVRIGKNTRIYSMSLVNRNIEDNLICAGIPAKVIRTVSS